MDVSDSILIFGSQDEKLLRFLEKMGYRLSVLNSLKGVQDSISAAMPDCIIVDEQGGEESLEFCRFVKELRVSEHSPIVFISRNASTLREGEAAEIPKLVMVEAPYSVGSLVGKIATELRLRKFVGVDEDTASMAEVNAALKDLTGRLQRELDEAREIQQSLLPKSLPKDSRFQIAASYEPLEEVGGDWFYIHKTPSGKIAVQVADVTGHGLSAAFVGSMTKLAMVAADREIPSELLQEMNRLMYPQLREGTFVTMFSYLFDPDTGTLQYARAGHPPALLLRRESGEVTELLGEGFAVGFFDESEYSNEECVLEVGDVLITYTDAFPESQNMSGEVYGTARFGKALAATGPDDSASEIAGSLIEDFESFRGGRLLKDDVTLVCLKRVE